MPTIGIWVDKETKRKWEILNKHPDRVGIKELKKALDRIIEKYEWWFEAYERLKEQAMQKEIEVMNEVDSITEAEILSEI